MNDKNCDRGRWARCTLVQTTSEHFAKKQSKSEYTKNEKREK